MGVWNQTMDDGTEYDTIPETWGEDLGTSSMLMETYLGSCDVPWLKNMQINLHFKVVLEQAGKPLLNESGIQTVWYNRVHVFQ